MNLTEIRRDGALILSEAKSEDNKYIGKVKFLFAESDVKNKNERIYKSEILDTAIQDLEEQLEQGVLGCVMHPDSGETDLSKSSHLIKKLWSEGNKYFGEAFLLKTQAGKDIKALLETAIPIGVSMRGTGAIDGDGNILEGYEMRSIDFVFSPSFKNAKVMTEGLKAKTLEKLRKIYPNIFSKKNVKVADQVKESFQRTQEDILAGGKLKPGKNIT